LGLLAIAPAVAQAADSVKTTTDPAPVSGSVEITQKEITVRQGVITKVIPVNEVDYIVFETEPLKMKEARAAARKGEFDDVMKAIGKIDPSDIRRPEIKADYEFFKALASARLAMAGEGSKPDAGKLLVAFEKNYEQSYHYFDICEAMGDLFVSLNKHEQAAAYFSKLADSPWADLQMHGKVLLAQSLASQKKYKEAIAKFDDVLAANAGNNKQAEHEKQTAALGRATAIGATGKPEESIKAIQKMIDGAANEDDQFYAKAYNALGTCYQMAGKNKEALLAFLHTNLLYAQFPEEDAEALFNLSRLWSEVNQGNRGARALATLHEKYPYSPWAHAK
jgi:tetratricopeptide (TPR) repeat protein